MGKSIRLEDLHPGDIMLFEAPKDSWISQIISKLTDSCVSHTAISDYDPTYIYEEALKGAERAKLSYDGKNAIFIRRINTGADTGIVVDIANEYVQKHTPYGMLNLALLGLYMLGYNYSKKTKYADLIVTVLKITVYEIIKFADTKYYHDEDVYPMVCSQYAARCYDVAAEKKGPEYKIRYNRNVTSVRNLLKDIIDYVKERFSGTYEYNDDPALVYQNCNDKNPEEKYLKEFLEVLENDDESDAANLGSNGFITDEMVKLFYIYGSILLGRKKYKDITKESVSGRDFVKLFDDLLKFQETFITPEDLLSNTENLMDMGELDL